MESLQSVTVGDYKVTDTVTEPISKPTLIRQNAFYNKFFPNPGLIPVSSPLIENKVDSEIIALGKYFDKTDAGRFYLAYYRTPGTSSYIAAQACPKRLIDLHTELVQYKVSPKELGSIQCYEDMIVLHRKYQERHARHLASKVNKGPGSVNTREKVCQLSHVYFNKGEGGKLKQKPYEVRIPYHDRTVCIGSYHSQLTAARVADIYNLVFNGIDYTDSKTASSYLELNQPQYLSSYQSDSLWKEAEEAKACIDNELSKKRKQVDSTTGQPVLKKRKPTPEDNGIPRLVTYSNNLNLEYRTMHTTPQNIAEVIQILEKRYDPLITPTQVTSSMEETLSADQDAARAAAACAVMALHDAVNMCQ